MTSPAADRTPLRIDVISDVVCPWCFIGKARLEKALALRPDIPVEVRYHPYFLNDWIPRAGIGREEYLKKKFGSVEGYLSRATQVAEAAAEEGLTYNVKGISRQPNTMDCHRLIFWAGPAGLASPMKQKLMELYFTDGADLTDPETLVRAAADVGLDADAVRRDLATDKDVDTVARQAQSARDAGIEGVPCFIFGGIAGVSGAQSPEYLADVLGQAADKLQAAE